MAVDTIGGEPMGSVDAFAESLALSARFSYRPPFGG
jgi:hypothetical protein